MISKTALIVDDALFMRELIKDALNGICELIYEESDIESAWHTFVNCKPAIITMDLSLDVHESMQGMKLIQKMKEYSVGSHIIIISALDQSSIREEAKQYGVSYYMPKPFDKMELRNVVQKILEEHI